MQTVTCDTLPDTLIGLAEFVDIHSVSSVIHHMDKMGWLNLYHLVS